MAYTNLYDLVRSELRQGESTLPNDDLLERHKALAYRLEQEGLPILMKEDTVELTEGQTAPVTYDFVEHGFIYVSGLYNSYGNTLSELPPTSLGEDYYDSYRKVGSAIHFLNVQYFPITVRGFSTYTPSDEDTDVIFKNKSNLLLSGLMYYTRMWQESAPEVIEEYRVRFEEELTKSKRESVVTIIDRRR